MWCSHHSFLQLVEDSWSSTISASPLGAFSQKLRCLKACLKNWNSLIFKNIFDRVRAAEESLIHAESLFDENPSVDNKEKWASAQLAFSSELRIENSYLAKKRGSNGWSKVTRIQKFSILQFVRKSIFFLFEKF